MEIIWRRRRRGKKKVDRISHTAAPELMRCQIGVLTITVLSKTNLLPKKWLGGGADGLLLPLLLLGFLMISLKKKTDHLTWKLWVNFEERVDWSKAKKSGKRRWERVSDGDKNKSKEYEGKKERCELINWSTLFNVSDVDKWDWWCDFCQKYSLKCLNNGELVLVVDDDVIACQEQLKDHHNRFDFTLYTFQTVVERQMHRPWEHTKFHCQSSPDEWNDTHRVDDENVNQDKDNRTERESEMQISDKMVTTCVCVCVCLINERMKCKQCKIMANENKEKRDTHCFNVKDKLN